MYRFDKFRIQTKNIFENVNSKHKTALCIILYAFLSKMCVIIKLAFLKCFDQIRFQTKKITEKVYFQIKMWPSMTSEFILQIKKKLHLHNDRIHSKCYENRFVNKCTRIERFSLNPIRTELLWDVEELTFIIIIEIQ